MKATGIVRRVDQLGRIVIPKELRRTMNIDIKEPIEIYVDDGGKYEICKLQNLIKLYDKHQEKTWVICPYCSKRQARVKGDKWHCSECGKKGSALELLRLVEEEYIAKHQMYFWDSKTNKGVEL